MEFAVGLVVIVAGLAWWGRRIEKRKATDVAPPRGAPSPSRGGSVRLSCDGRVSVVGESHYQPALKKAAGGRTVPEGKFDQAISVQATLVPEPSNKYDRNAVKVEVGGRTVGYLPRELASEYQPALRGLGAVGWCEGRIMGGKGRPYGIFLYLGAPERLVLGNSSDGVEMLAPDRVTTVTGEQKHQDVLEQLPGEQSDGVFPPMVATLVRSEVSGGKYAGEPCLEVRIDGRRVGELTRRMSERYLPLVEQVIARGGTPGCEAFIRRVDGKGIQVELRTPKV